MLLRATIMLPCAALLMAGVVLADQSAPGDRLPPIDGPVIEIPSSEPLELEGAPDRSRPERSRESAGEAHLDALLTNLADPLNENWAQTQMQIESLWKQSGSPAMDLLASRADKAIRAKDFDAALGFLDDLTRLAPDFAEGWKMRATVHFMREDYRKALEDVARTLALEPRHFEAIAGLGLMLDRLGEKKGALEAYRRAHEIHPNLPGAADGIRKLTREVEGNRA